MIFCRTLGPPLVTIDGAPPPPALLWRKHLALLVYLARSPERSRTREHLTALLWGDKPDSAARQSLREAVRVLRRSLGDPGVHADSRTIALDPAAVTLDTDQFEALESRGDLDAAAALVDGEFMEGFTVPDASPFEDWLAVERTRWRSKSVGAVVASCDLSIARGQVHEAAATALRAIALDPTSNRAVQRAMRAHALLGERAVALTCFDQFTQRLGDLDLQPNHETTALATRVRAQRTWNLPASVPRDERSGAQLRRAPLVGREQELERLLESWHESVNDRRALTLLIVADAGIGKTRLAEEFEARARLAGAIVATVRGVEADRQRPFSAILGIAEGLANAPGVAAAPPEALAAFTHRLPDWTDRFGAPKNTPMPLDAALSRIVGVIADEHPVVLLLDDAQWSDRESLLGLVALTRDVATRPLAVGFALEPHPSRSELDNLRSLIGRDVAGVTVRPGPLDETALRRLATWALPTSDEDQIDRVARRVHADSAGIPLLAVELLHAVALGLELEHVPGVWPAPFHTLSQTMPGDLPDAIIAAIRVGFRRLSQPAQQVLAGTSVLPEPVSEQLLAAALGLDPGTLAAALDELEWQRWLSADARGYAFVARIVRDVIARDMLTTGQKERILRAVS